MDAKLLAKLLFRMLAVYTIVEGIMQLSTLSSLESRVNNPQGELLIVVAISASITGLLLWVIAPKLAGWAVGRPTTSTATSSIDAANLQSIGFACIGMLLVAEALPRLIFRIFESIVLSTLASNALLNSPITSAYFYGDASKLIVGLVLLFGAKFFTRQLRRFREFGLPPTSSE
jgi:hypothetical protein